MAFCRFCGKQLADGEACDCEGARADAAKNQVNAAVNEVTDAAADAADKVAEQAGEVQEAVEDTAEKTQNTVKDAAGEALNAIGEGFDQAKDKITQGAASAVNGLSGFFQKNKGLAMIAGIACAAVVLIVLLVSLFGGKGYKKPIDALVKEINRGTKTDYISLVSAGLPSDLVKLNKLYYGKVIADRTEDKDDSLKDSFEDLEDECKGWKIVFKYDKKEKMTKRELEKYQDNYDPDDYEDMLDEFDDMDELVEQYANWYDADEDDVEDYFKALVKYLKTFKKIKISKGYKVKGYYILKDGSEEVNKTNKVTLYVVKLNGEWVVIGSKDGDSFSFDSGDDGYKETKFLREFINTFYPSRMIPGM